MSLLYLCKLFIAFFIALGCSENINNPEEYEIEEPEVPEIIVPTLYETIIERIQTEHSNVNIANVTENVNQYVAKLNDNGSFSDIDYSRKDQTNWPPIIHLDRLKSLVQAYTVSGGQYYENDALYEKIISALQFWHDKHPTSTNWYMQQIACPQRMGVLLVLLRAGKQQLPTALEEKLLERMRQEGGRPDQPGSQGTGANKMDIATHWVYRGCLTADSSVLAFGVEQVYYPLFLTTDEGLQHDFSYQQHGAQLYIGGYGNVLINGIGSIASYMTNTPFALPVEKAALLSQFVRITYIPTIRGQYSLYNVLGRGLSRKNALYQGSFVRQIERMKVLDPAHAGIYEAAGKRLSGAQDASYGLLPEHTHFWRSDYTLHQRPEYTFDTRMASVFTARNENGNKENLLGYFLTDGATTITTRGNEYVDIFPVWDWAMIPGITAPHVAAIPLPKEWEVRGKSRFAGGVSDGRYGVSAYWLNDNDYGILTQAKKSWFYFDDEVVCLGAGIQSSNSESVYTTVNQCLLQGAVEIHTQGASQVLGSGSRTFQNPSWIWHNNVGYYFPQGGNISVSNQVQNGNWKTINTPIGDAPVSKEVFKMWFDHGMNPQQEAYAYIVVPEQVAGGYSVANVKILANTDSVQVVHHEQLNLYGLVFYQKATFESDNMKVQADKGCVLLLKNVGTPQVVVYIAEPSRMQSVVNLTATLPGINGQKSLRCAFSVNTDSQAGATKEYVIN